MRKKPLIALVAVALGLGLAQGELMTPGGLPLPLGPVWRKLPSAEECRGVWEAVKKEISLTGFPEPRKELNCLYFDKRSKNVALGWEMGDRTLSQVFTEGWQRQKGTFDLLRRNSYNNRALSIVTMQSSKVFVAILTGMNAYTMSMNVEGIVALERENDVVLVEPR